MKVLTIIGTRPEIIKLSRVMPCLDQHTRHVIVHTGQNHDYELNEIFFKELGLRKPDYFLNAVGDTLAETMGLIIAKADKVFAKEKPDALLVLGDTNSALSAIAAKRRKIPIFHMEAGNRCFDDRVPEEINRRIVDHISDINMPYTEHARRYLLAEGLRSDTIIKTGSTMKEVLDFYSTKIDASNALKRLKLRPRSYFVVSAHREENIDSVKNFSDFLQTLNRIAKRFRKTIIVSTHPRTRKKLTATRGVKLDPRIHFLKPMGFFDYVKLQRSAFCVVSDSGTITEESSMLQFPAVTIRQAHERPEGNDEGTLIMCGLAPERVIEAIEVVTSQYYKEGYRPCAIKDFDKAGCVSKKVVRTILSYTDYVNRKVWYR